MSYEHERHIIFRFQINGKLQYYGIYSKLNRRNKLCSKDKFGDDNLDDEADYRYLCGGSENMPRDYYIDC